MKLEIPGVEGGDIKQITGSWGGDQPRKKGCGLRQGQRTENFAGPQKQTLRTGLAGSDWYDIPTEG